MKLIKIMEYPWLAFGVKRLVKTSLNRFCVVLQLSKFQQTVNQTSVLGLNRLMLFPVLIGYGSVRLQSFSSFVTGLPNTTLDSPQNRARCSVLGLFDLPRLRLPSTTLNTPEIERDARFGVFSTSWASTSLENPEIEHDARFQLPWAPTSLDNPRNRARCSVWGVFNLPGL